MEFKRDSRSPTPKNISVSALMSKIKSSNTKPELLFRKLIYSLGYRGYRINYKKLPGKPDVVFNKKKVAIFINGCYWHGCEKCGWKKPTHNSEYWTLKITKTKERDNMKRKNLEDLGYTVLVFWEHDLKSNQNDIIDLLSYFL